ncbi:hypothetical protein AAEX28_14520 [Lentisphaerota bacterium WC36G]|nr:hypothetical protein LJT99_01275 [Lentisphaerae bacterium WC36]
MTNEVKALILSFVKELTDRDIAKASDFNFISEQLNFMPKDGEFADSNCQIVKEGQLAS